MIANTDALWAGIDGRAAAYAAFSDRIWDMPELNFAENRSAAEHAAMLAAEGFRVTQGVAGLPTAVLGEAGEGGPVIAFLGEYDALPGLSQVAGADEPHPLEPGGPGHGCGHNLLGAGSLLAAAALKQWLAAQGIPGRVRYYGCPAEEGGAGKAFMVRAGAFADVDAALSWHPAAFSGVNEAKSLAFQMIDFSFTGQASHTAVSPHLGRSALDAAELMNIGANFLREHMPDGSRLHYAFLDVGGIAANVVQASAGLRYIVRAPTVPSLLDLAARIGRVATGAAIMTDTEVSSRVVSAMSNLLANAPLSAAMQSVLDHLGPPVFDDADRIYAARMQATVGEQAVSGAYAIAGLRPGGGPLAEQAIPVGALILPQNGSTDVGDVSWAVPTVQLRGATFAIGTQYHTWQVTAQGKSPAAHKGMVHAAKVLAMTAAELFRRPDLLRDAATALHASLHRQPWRSPLPADTQPGL